SAPNSEAQRLVTSGKLVGHWPWAKSPDSKPVFHGWKIVAGAMAIQALIAGLFQQAYGVYATFWMSEFGWSSTTIALAYSLHRTESALLGPPHGWLLLKFSPRSIVLVGIVML